jgi:hypothetical protein
MRGYACCHLPCRGFVRFLAFAATSTCSDLIPSGHLLDYIPAFQLEFFENSGSLLLTLANNKLGFSEKNLITSAAAGID